MLTQVTQLQWGRDRNPPSEAGKSRSVYKERTNKSFLQETWLHFQEWSAARGGFRAKTKGFWFLGGRQIFKKNQRTQRKVTVNRIKGERRFREIHWNYKREMNQLSSKRIRGKKPVVETSLEPERFSGGGPCRG